MVGGKLHVRAGKRGREFGTVQELRDFVADRVTDPDYLLALVLWIALTRNASLAGLNALAGKTLTIDSAVDLTVGGIA